MRKGRNRIVEKGRNRIAEKRKEPYSRGKEVTSDFVIPTVERFCLSYLLLFSVCHSTQA